jgi:DnaB-like helicase C terminal domain
MESRILSACLKRSAYEEVKGVLGDSLSTTFSPIAQVVAKLLEDYYSRDGAAATCSKEVIVQRAQAEIANPKHLTAIEEFTRGLDETISVPNLLHDIRQQRKRRIGDKLAGLLANRAEGNDVQTLIQQYQELDRDPEHTSDTDSSEVYKGYSVKEMLDRHFSREGTIGLGTPRLISACDGGARAGHHILVYGRPELGKTLLSIDLVTPVLSRGYGVIHFGNEEPMPDTIIRYLMRITGWTKERIRSDPEGAERFSLSKGYDNLIGISVSPGRFTEFRHAIDKYKPAIVVLDQLRNVEEAGSGGNRAEALDNAARGARDLGKQTGTIVISVTQAGDSAESKPFLGLSDIDSSKTGIPGAIDLAIGIGATEEYKRSGIRGISLPKNKLGGKHETWLARFNTQTGEVTDLSE